MSIIVEIVTFDQESEGVGISPDPGPIVVMDPVIGDCGTFYGPEFAPTRATTPWSDRFDIVSVVVAKFIAVEDNILYPRGSKTDDTVLTVLGDAIGSYDIVATDTEPGSGVARNGAIAHSPAGSADAIHNWLIKPPIKVDDREVANGDPGCVAADSKMLYVLPIYHGSRRTEKGCVVRRRYLAEFAGPKSMSSRCQPIGRAVCRSPVRVVRQILKEPRVVAGRNSYGACRGGRWTVEYAGISADLAGRGGGIGSWRGWRS